MALSYSKWLRLFIYGGIALIIFSLYYNYRIAKLFLTPTELEMQVVRESSIEDGKFLEDENKLWIKLGERKKKGSRYFPIMIEEKNEGLQVPLEENDDYSLLVRQATEKGAFVFLNYLICFLFFFTGFLPFFWAADGSKLKFFGQELLGFLVVSSLMITVRYFFN